MTAPDDSIDDAALRWLLERDEGFAPGRAALFRAWCAADARHAVAIERAEAGLALLGEMPAAAPVIERRLAARCAATARARPRGTWVAFPRLAAWTAAAGLAAALVVFVFIRPEPPAGSGERFVTDAATVRRQVALADGSVLHVNAATALRVELGARERRVALENGEAHFAVAPDQARPFVVAAGGLRIRAVGTAFDVRAVGDEVQVIVHEGRVEVATDGRISGAPSPILAAGERVVARAGRVQPVERLDAPALRTALAWHGATVVFIDTPLRDVVARFNAHNTLQLTLADPALAARRIGGTFSLDRVDALVSLLEQEGDVAVERRPGDNAVVLRRK